MLDEGFFSRVAVTSARAPIMDADVIEAVRNDPPPEAHTDLFGEQKRA